MNPENALIAITIIGAIGTCANVYLTITIKNEILKTRLWVTETFVKREDLRSVIGMSQLRESAERVAHSR